VLHVSDDDSAAWKCPNRTFEAMCARNDSWACTMWRASFVYGRGDKPNVARALEVLPRGCFRGEDDPACAGARTLLEEARKAH